MDKIALIAERDALRAELDEAREALRPFAKKAWDEDVRSDETIVFATWRFRLGDLRRAAVLLKDK